MPPSLHPSASSQGILKPRNPHALSIPPLPPSFIPSMDESRHLDNETKNYVIEQLKENFAIPEDKEFDVAYWTKDKMVAVLKSRSDQIRRAYQNGDGNPTSCHNNYWKKAKQELKNICRRLT